jgi:hypothetical protein
MHFVFDIIQRYSQIEVLEFLRREQGVVWVGLKIAQLDLHSIVRLVELRALELSSSTIGVIFCGRS